MDCRYWNKDFMVEFIETYKSFPCLWKVKSKDYTDRVLKNEAYDELVTLCRKIHPEANRDFVVKKIQSIRGSFRKELNKIKESKRNGSRRVHVPSLWYFDLLLFIQDQEIDSGDINDGDLEEVESTLKRKQNDMEDIKPSVKRSTVFTEAKEIVESRKSTPVNTPVSLLNTSINTLSIPVSTLSAAISHPSDSTEFEAVGVSVGKKLQRMDPTQAIYAESLINLVLRKGLLHSLTENSAVCDGQCNSPQYEREYIRPASAFSTYSENSPSTSH